MQVIKISNQTLVPKEIITNCTRLVSDLTFEVKTYTGSTFYCLAEKYTGTGNYLVPRALDLSPYLKNSGDRSIEAEPLLRDYWWPDTCLTTWPLPALGPNKYIRYDQRPAWEALSSPPAWPWGKILALGCGKGKALAHGEPVLLSKGWTPIEDVSLGDFAASTDGKFYPVTGVFPQGKRKIYRLIFTDGTHVDCDLDHQWTFDMRRTSTPRRVTLTVRELLQANLRGPAGRRFYLPGIEPIDTRQEKCPLDPYTLGAILGDGCLVGSSARFSSADLEIVDQLDVEAVPLSDYDFGLPGFMARAKEIGIWGTKSDTKFIPDVYFWVSPEDRLSLLQGLFDTDGTITASGAVEYTSVSPHLIEGVRRLVQSLGGTATEGKPRRPWYTYKGEKKQGKLAYRLLVKLPKGMRSFRLERKQSKMKVDRQREPYRALGRIEYVGELPATCISVSSPDSLFLTRGYVPTHNTVLGLRLACSRRVKTLVVCHTVAMIDTWATLARKLFGIDPGDMGFIGGGKLDWEGKKLVFTTMKGVVCREYPEHFYTDFGLILLDEGDLLGTEKLHKMLPLFLGERVMLTATPSRRDGADFLYKNHVGPVCYYDVEPDLKPTCYVLDSPTPVSVKGKPMEGYAWSRYINGMAPHIPRTINKLTDYAPRRDWAFDIVMRLLREGRKVLFLGERVDELKDLSERLKNTGGHFKSGLALGNSHMKGQKLDEILNSCDCVWGIAKIAKRGLNEPAFDTLVIQYATFNDPNILQQASGRVLRFLEGKNDPLVIILNDAEIICMDKNAQKLAKQLKKDGYSVEWYQQ